MSTIIGIHYDKESGTYLYEEAFPIEDPSPAYIRVGAGRFKIEHEFADKLPRVTIEIPAELMDMVSITWLEHRKLHGALIVPE